MLFAFALPWIVPTTLAVAGLLMIAGAVLLLFWRRFKDEESKDATIRRHG